MMFIYLSVLISFITVVSVLVYRLGRPAPPPRRFGPPVIVLPPAAPQLGGGYERASVVPAGAGPYDHTAAVDTMVPVDAARSLMPEIDRTFLTLTQTDTGFLSCRLAKQRLENAIALMRLQGEFIAVAGKAAVDARDVIADVKMRDRFIDAIDELADVEKRFKLKQGEVAIETLNHQREQIIARIEALARTGRVGRTTGPERDGSSTVADLSKVKR